VDHDDADSSEAVGAESVKQTAKRLQATFNPQFEVHDEIAEGDMVVQLVTIWVCSSSLNSYPRSRESPISGPIGDETRTRAGTDLLPVPALVV